MQLILRPASDNIHFIRPVVVNRFPTPSLDSYQYSNNTIILFATQSENNNTTFHWSSAVSGGLALLRAFCQC